MIDRPTAEGFLAGLHRALFEREPAAADLHQQIEMLEAGLPPQQLVTTLLESSEFGERLRHGRRPVLQSPEPDSTKAKLTYADWPDLYIRNIDWEEQYKAGEHDHMVGIGELPHYAIVAGYIHKLVGQGRLLDAGCGEGVLTEYLDLDRIDYLGFDVSSTAVERANRRIRRGCAFTCSFDGFVPPPESAFDVIVFDGSLLHVEFPLEVIDRFREFLRENGAIIVTCFQRKDGLGGTLLARFLGEACERHRYLLVDTADAVSVSHQLSWRIFVLR